jgi:K+-sensing histidine kinase KdpD
MTLDDRLKRAVDTLGDKLRDDIARELQALSSEWAGADRRDAATTRLSDAMRAIDSANSLSEILDALAASVSNEAARSGIFLLRGGALRSFRLFGFSSRQDEAPIDMAMTDAGVMSDAIAQQTVATSATSPFDDLPQGVHAMAAPIVLAGAPVGVVYAEGADLAIVEMLTRFAARALEAQTALKAARAVVDDDLGLLTRAEKP